MVAPQEQEAVAREPWPSCIEKFIKFRSQELR